MHQSSVALGSLAVQEQGVGVGSIEVGDPVGSMGGGPSLAVDVALLSLERHLHISS